MAWRIEFERGAEKDLDKLGPQVATRILRFLFERIAPLDDPRSIGEALKGLAWEISGSTAWATTAS